MLWLALLGGVMGLDTVSCVQSMISRPIVVGPLAGALLGDPVSGMYAGVLLELVSLNQLPIGASRGWDTGPATVAASAVVALQASSGPVTWIVAAGFGVFVGWVGGWTVHVMRQGTARIVSDERRRSITPRALSARHLSALAIDFFRAAGLTLVALVCGSFVLAGSEAAPAVASSAAAVVLLAFVGLTLSADVRMIAKGRPVAIAFAAGLIVSSMIALWRG